MRSIQLGVLALALGCLGSVSAFDFEQLDALDAAERTELLDHAQQAARDGDFDRARDLLGQARNKPGDPADLRALEDTISKTEQRLAAEQRRAEQQRRAAEQAAEAEAELAFDPRFPAQPASRPGMTTCNTRCINRDCFRTYDNGRRVRFVANMKYNPFNSSWEVDSGGC